mgnify:CR=1 FL=1
MSERISQLLDELIAESRKDGAFIVVSPYYIRVGSVTIPPKGTLPSGDIGQDPETLRALAAAVEKEANLPQGRVTLQSQERTGVKNYVLR